MELGASRRARTRKAHQRVRLRFLLLDIEPTATPYAVYLCLCDCLGAAPCPSNRERVVMPPCLFSVRAPRPWTQSVGQLIPPPVSHSWSASPFACLLPALPSALSRRSRRRWIATLEANSSLRHDPWTQSGPLSRGIFVLIFLSLSPLAVLLLVGRVCQAIIRRLSLSLSVDFSPPPLSVLAFAVHHQHASSHVLQLGWIAILGEFFTWTLDLSLLKSHLQQMTIESIGHEQGEMKRWPSTKLHFVPLYRPSRMIALHNRRLHTHPFPLTSSSPLPVDHLLLVPLLLLQYYMHIALCRTLVWSSCVCTGYELRLDLQLHRHTHLCSLTERHQQVHLPAIQGTGDGLGVYYVLVLLGMIGDVHRHGVFPMMHLNRYSCRGLPLARTKLQSIASF